MCTMRDVKNLEERCYPHHDDNEADDCADSPKDVHRLFVSVINYEDD